MHRLLVYNKQKTHKKKEQKKNVRLQTNMHRLRGKKEKGQQIFPSLGAVIICNTTPLCLLFLFFVPSEKDLQQASGRSSYATQRLSASSLRTCQQSWR
jgi:hypothetical protein